MTAKNGHEYDWVPNIRQIVERQEDARLAKEFEERGVELVTQATTMLQEAKFYETLASILRGEDAEASTSRS